MPRAPAVTKGGSSGWDFKLTHYPALGLRVAFDLAKLLADDDRLTEAVALLGPLLDHFPSGASSRHWRAARSWYCLRLAHAG